jgi:hypothetical protein
VVYQAPLLSVSFIRLDGGPVTEYLSETKELPFLGDAPQLGLLQRRKVCNAAVRQPSVRVCYRLVEPDQFAHV